MDLTVKCMRNVIPRMEQQVVRLFDSLKCPSMATMNYKNPALVEQARENLDTIRMLYLEQM